MISLARLVWVIIRLHRRVQMFYASAAAPFFLPLLLLDHTDMLFSHQHRSYRSGIKLSARSRFIICCRGLEFNFCEIYKIGDLTVSDTHRNLRRDQSNRLILQELAEVLWKNQCICTRSRIQHQLDHEIYNAAGNCLRCRATILNVDSIRNWKTFISWGTSQHYHEE